MQYLRLIFIVWAVMFCLFCAFMFFALFGDLTAMILLLIAAALGLLVLVKAVNWNPDGTERPEQRSLREQFSSARENIRNRQPFESDRTGEELRESGGRMIWSTAPGKNFASDTKEGTQTVYAAEEYRETQGRMIWSTMPEHNFRD